MKVCDKTCIFCFFPIINKYLCIAKRSLLSELPSYNLINVTLSCPCAHYEDIWERGGTTPHIINPVLLHTMPSDNILATGVSMLTFLLLHKISLPIKWNRWVFHSLPILVSLFLWVMISGQTYPHSLALSGTLVLYECVWSASHYTCFTLGENALSTNRTGGSMDKRFGLEAL